MCNVIKQSIFTSLCCCDIHNVCWILMTTGALCSSPRDVILSKAAHVWTDISEDDESVDIQNREQNIMALNYCSVSSAQHSSPISRMFIHVRAGAVIRRVQEFLTPPHYGSKLSMLHCVLQKVKGDRFEWGGGVSGCFPHRRTLHQNHSLLCPVPASPDVASWPPAAPTPSSSTERERKKCDEGPRWSLEFSCTHYNTLIPFKLVSSQIQLNWKWWGYMLRWVTSVFMFVICDGMWIIDITAVDENQTKMTNVTFIKRRSFFGSQEHLSNPSELTNCQSFGLI